MFCDGPPMRIDAMNLLAAQTALQPQRAHSVPHRPVPVADKPLFEPLNFSTVRAETAPAGGPQEAPRRLGSQVDITI